MLHVLTRLVLGGPLRPLLATLGELEALGVEAALAVGPAGVDDASGEPLVRRAGLDRLHELPRLVRAPSPLLDLGAYAELRALLARLRPDVLHTHTAKAGALGRVAATRRGASRPLRAHTFHGHSLTRASSGSGAPLWRIAERLLVRASDLLVALSPSQGSELGALLGAAAGARLRVVPLALDPRRYGATTRLAPRTEAPALEGTPRPRRLAFVGRGVAVKGLDLLAEAHARLDATRGALARRLELRVIGPLEHALRARVEERLGHAGLREHWHLEGPSLDPMGALERSGAEGLVLPSRSEGTPVALLEAFAAGLPVLAAEVGGVRELVAARWEQRAPGRWRTSPSAARGLLLPPSDADAWAAALGAFVEDPRIVPGEPTERRAFVAEVFDPAARTRELLALYAAAGARRFAGLADGSRSDDATAPG